MISNILRLIGDTFEDLRIDLLSLMNKLSIQSSCAPLLSFHNHIFSLPSPLSVLSETLWHKVHKIILSYKNLNFTGQLLTGSLFLLTFLTSLLKLLPPKFLRRKEINMKKEEISMVDKTVLVTGANRGVGYFTALELAGRGSRVILTCRNLKEGDYAADAIRKLARNVNVVVEAVDMSDMSDVRRFVDYVRELTMDRLDVLVCNGSTSVDRFYRTEGGLELQMATNHLGFFLLVNLLLPALANVQGKIATVTSDHYKGAQMEISNLNSELYFNASRAFSNSQLANILFTVELARRCRLAGVPITANCINPGNPSLTETLANLNPFRWLNSVSPREGASCLVSNLTSGARMSGELVVGGKVVTRSVVGGTLGPQLWERSKELTQLEVEETIV